MLPIWQFLYYYIIISYNTFVSQFFCAEYLKCGNETPLCIGVPDVAFRPKILGNRLSILT